MVQPLHLRHQELERKHTWHENEQNNKKGVHLKLVSDIIFYLSLQAHVIEH